MGWKNTNSASWGHLVIKNNAWNTDLHQPHFWVKPSGEATRVRERLISLAYSTKSNKNLMHQPRHEKSIACKVGW